MTWLLETDFSVSSERLNSTQFELLAPVGEQTAAEIDTIRSGNDSKHTNLASLSIFVIDEDHDVHDVMQLLLVQHKCEVVIAESAKNTCKQLIDRE